MMLINELYDALNPLQGRFIEFCNDQGIENVYELTFLNYFYLEEINYKFIEVVELQTILFDYLRTFPDKSTITSRKKLKQVLSVTSNNTVNVPVNKVVEEKKEKTRNVQVEVQAQTTKQVTTPTPNINDDSIEKINKKDDGVVYDFSRLTEDRDSIKNVNLVAIKDIIPGYDRLIYKKFKIYTVNDYRYLSKNELLECFSNAKENKFNEMLNFLDFVGTLHNILLNEDEDENTPLIKRVTKEYYLLSYKCSIERIFDLKTVKKVLMLYGLLNKEQREEFLIELVN